MVKSDRKRITITFTEEEYEVIRNLASKQNISMSEVVRNFSVQGINGNLTESNMDFLIPIIRDQLKSIIEPSVNRLAALSAKTCVQAGTAAYLTAETINKFVAPSEREDLAITYEAARKKAVHYLKSKTDM